MIRDQESEYEAPRDVSQENGVCQSLDQCVLKCHSCGKLRITFTLQGKRFTAARALRKYPCSSQTTMTNLVLPSQKQVPNALNHQVLKSYICDSSKNFTPDTKTTQILVKANKKTATTTSIHHIHRSHQNTNCFQRYISNPFGKRPNAATVTGRSFARSQGPTKRLGWKRRHLDG